MASPPGWGGPVSPPPSPGWGGPAAPPPPSGWGGPTAQGGSYPSGPYPTAPAGGWAPQPPPPEDWAGQDEPLRPRDPKLLLLLLAVVGIVVVAGVVAFLLLGRHGSTGTPAAAPPSTSSASSGPMSSTSSAPASSSAPAGAVTATPEAQPGAGAEPLPLVATGADCTYPPGVDGANQPVTYEPAKAVDADATTAWRCPGAGGHTIRMTLGEAGSVTDLGLVPGYAKVDPATGVNRFTDNHTVTQVVWQLEQSGQTIRITQDLADPAPQTAWVHLSRPVALSALSLTVTGTGNPGARQDSTPISTIAVAGTLGTTGG